MKYIVRSSIARTASARDSVESTLKEILQSMVVGGRHYVTYSATLGGTDSSGARIEEAVTIVEDLGDAQVV